MVKKIRNKKNFKDIQSCINLTEIYMKNHIIA